MTLFFRSFFTTSTFCVVVVVVDVVEVVDVLRDAAIATLLSAEELSFLVASAAAEDENDSLLEAAEVVTTDDTSPPSAGATWMFRVRFALISPLVLLTTHLYRPACSVVAFWRYVRKGFISKCIVAL